MDATDHDQLFKNVIREFLPDFLMLFFPELAAGFDLSAVAWLNQELFPNPPAGPKHVLDLVAELRSLGGGVVRRQQRRQDTPGGGEDGEPVGPA